MGPRGVLVEVEPPILRFFCASCSSLEVASMNFMGAMLRSRGVHLVTRYALKSEGFDPYWSLVDRLVGGLQWGAGEKLFPINTTPRDGVCEGRWEMILRSIEHATKKLVRCYFTRPDPLDPLISECKVLVYLPISPKVRTTDLPSSGYPRTCFVQLYMHIRSVLLVPTLVFCGYRQLVPL